MLNENSFNTKCKEELFLKNTVRHTGTWIRTELSRIHDRRREQESRYHCCPPANPSGSLSQKSVPFEVLVTEYPSILFFY